MISIIILVVLALLGFWAIKTIEPGGAHVDKQKLKALEEQNEELAEEVEKLKDELALLQPVEEEVIEEKPAEEVVEEKPAPTTYKNQTLINELQKLVDENIYMKVGSKGTRVGTVQNFLNLYNKTSKRVDNDYGNGTKTDVIGFQKKEGLTADGETGPTTYKKMIEWLKKQG